jgi:hypothetical protein
MILDNRKLKKKLVGVLRFEQMALPCFRHRERY